MERHRRSMKMLSIRRPRPSTRCQQVFAGKRREGDPHLGFGQRGNSARPGDLAALVHCPAGLSAELPREGVSRSQVGRTGRWRPSGPRRRGPRALAIVTRTNGAPMARCSTAASSEPCASPSPSLSGSCCALPCRAVDRHEIEDAAPTGEKGNVRTPFARQAVRASPRGGPGSANR